MNVGGMCFALHAVTKSNSVVFYLSVHLLFCCCRSLFIGLHILHLDSVSCLSRPPTPLNWSPHTLLRFNLIYRKKKRDEREGERNPSHLFQTETQMQWVERKRMCFLLGNPHVGWMMSSHPQLTSAVFPHVKRPTVRTHHTTAHHTLVLSEGIQDTPTLINIWHDYSPIVFHYCIHPFRMTVLVIPVLFQWSSSLDHWMSEMLV